MEFRLRRDRGAALHETIRRELLHQAIASGRLANVQGVGLLALAAWTLRHDVPTGRLFTWIAFVATDMVGYELVARWALRPQRPVQAAATAICCIAAYGGIAWGSGVWLAAPVAGHEGDYAVLFAIALIAAAGNLVFGSSSSLTFLAFHVPLGLVACTSLFLAGPSVATTLGVVLMFTLVGATTLHRELHRALADVRVILHEKSELLGALRHEQAAVMSANAELEWRATRDALTGLANREMFYEQLHLALARARRSGRSVGVLFFDLDRFKVVNDSLGHAAGDELLRTVAQRVRQVVREGDVLARLGGDEFTVLVSEMADPQEAVAVAHRVHSVFAEPFDLGERVLAVSPSIGVAHNADLVDTADDLLRHADVALYRAKENGRNRVEVFDESLRARLRRRVDDEAEIRAALASGQFEAWYQPVVRLGDGAMVAAETLARWRHPERGILLPREFLPIMTEAGLLDELFKVVSTQSLRLRAAIDPWCGPEFRVVVNAVANGGSVAPSAQTLYELAEATGLTLSGVGIELTEQAFVRDPLGTADQLRSLRAQGVAVALDDFGTGASSLSLVRDLDLDFLKIDLRFVQGMLNDRRDAAVVASVVELAHQLGMLAGAEGVETMEQLAHLRGLGADLAQGFLFSPAVEGEQLTEWLRGVPPWVEAIASA